MKLMLFVVMVVLIPLAGAAVLILLRPSESPDEHSL